MLIDSRRLDAGNIFVPVKENSELSLACISEGGNPKPTLSWEVLLSPGVDRHAQKVAAEVLELQEVTNEKVCKCYNMENMHILYRLTKVSVLLLLHIRIWILNQISFAFP